MILRCMLRVRDWLEYLLHGLCNSGVHFYTVALPHAMKINETANLVVETVETHATYPWPEQASQKDPQSLKYETDLFVVSPYKTLVERIKFRYVLSRQPLTTNMNAVPGLPLPISILTLILPALTTSPSKSQ